MYYQAQLNYSRQFGKHDIGATGVFTREELATVVNSFAIVKTGYSVLPIIMTHRYFMEFNGAYNGF